MEEGGNDLLSKEECSVIINTKPEECQEIRAAMVAGKFPKYVLDKDLIYFRDKWNNKKIFVPKKARNLVLKYLHSSTREAHMAHIKTQA
ncbi:hypothetical protein PR048_017240 [Dryococelus australis]|uniref:Uncharacterized protein n=1 Tax=Dryococelus australis TaxID=614101 RepID=A0ABQ9H922_9NEOP|nr:hypothetical protein PR048_017240 [Dryococelus australis]